MARVRFINPEGYDGWMTPAEAAEYMNKHIAHVRNLVANDKLRNIKVQVGNAKRVLIDPLSCDEYLATAKTARTRSGLRRYLIRFDPSQVTAVQIAAVLEDNLDDGSYTFEPAYQPKNGNGNNGEPTAPQLAQIIEALTS